MQDNRDNDAAGAFTEPGSATKVCNYSQLFSTRRYYEVKYARIIILLLIGMLAWSAGIGLYFWRVGQSSTADSLLGGHSLGLYPITASLIGNIFVKPQYLS